MRSKKRRYGTGFLKDGRLAGLVARAIVVELVRRPGQVVSPEDLAAAVWPHGLPGAWRVSLPAHVRRVNTIIGKPAIERIGNQSELVGFRLDVRLLPQRSITAAPTKQLHRWKWTPAEDRVIRASVGSCTLSQITERVNAVHNRTRRPTGVEGRIYALGLSKKRAAFSAFQLTTIMGISCEQVTMWLTSGKLKGERGEPDGWTPGSKRGGRWVIQMADVEAFLRAYPWEYEASSIQRGHPLRALAEIIQQRQRYVTLDQFARQARVSSTTVLLWIKRGVVIGAQRVTPSGPDRDPTRTTWRIPLAALSTIGRSASR